MRLRLLALTLAAVLPAAVSAQAILNKCIDAQGRVTYSNLACDKARQVRKVEVDPAPPAAATAAPAATRRSAPAEPPATLELEAGHAPAKPVRASSRQCDSLTDKLGQVLDKMDQARRQGYRQEQMNRWNEDVRELERKKQQAGCF